MFWGLLPNFCLVVIGNNLQNIEVGKNHKRKLLFKENYIIYNFYLKYFYNKLTKKNM